MLNYQHRCNQIESSMELLSCSIPYRNTLSRTDIRGERYVLVCSSERMIVNCSQCNKEIDMEEVEIKYHSPVVN